jgi:hypothetical protein
MNLTEEFGGRQDDSKTNTIVKMSGQNVVDLGPML